MTDNVSFSGPLFDGRAEAALNRYITDVQEDIAQKGVDMVRIRLATVLKDNHGIYESRIHIERQTNDLMLTDTPIVYGPWLESTGSRDFPRTRFRGYHTFRQVTQALDAITDVLAEAKLKEGYLEAMND